MGNAVKKMLTEATLADVRTSVSGEVHRFVLNLIGTWDDDEADARHVRWVRRAWDSIRPRSTGAPYLDFLVEEDPARVRGAFRPRTFQRLAQVRRRYDSDNVFQINHTIAPARV